MSFREIRRYLLSKPEAKEDFPFGLSVTVMKIQSKMFATLAENGAVVSMNLKCDPHEARILRDIFPAVTPGYHMNKRHWNTVILDSSIPKGEIARMIDNSYSLVVQGLRKADRHALEVRHGRPALHPNIET
ncbi:MAG: MmcQ/YjbR family DNA-binding protein [Halioglobus sp.]|nr:MmcQ/YjbR family DNA-binding protein [Halioglobus sp.]